MRPVSVFPDYLVKLVIPASRAITKPAVICRCVPLFLAAALTRVMRAAVPIPALASASVLQSAVVGGSVVGVVGPL